MSCSHSTGREGRGGEFEQSVLRSVDSEPKLVSENGSISSPRLSIDDNLLVDPKLLFIGSKIGEGAHGRVYEGR